MEITIKEVANWVTPEAERILWNSALELEEVAAKEPDEKSRGGIFALSQIRKLEAMGFSTPLAYELRKAAGPARCVYAAWWALMAVKDFNEANRKKGESFPSSWGHIYLRGVMKDMIRSLDYKVSDRRGDYKKFFDLLGVRHPVDPTPHPNVHGYNRVLDGAILVLENYGFHQGLEMGRVQREAIKK